MKPALEVKRLHPAARLPARATPGAAGFDIHACLERPMVLAPGARGAVPTGLALAIPSEWVGLLCARSGLAARAGVVLTNGVGVIDADFRGELKVLLTNTGAEPFTVEPGVRIAQLVLVPAAFGEARWTDRLEATVRGQGGFGSTGLMPQSPSTTEKPV